MRGKGKLLSEQGRVLLSMIRGYRTLSGDACAVIAVVIPMDLEMERRRVMSVIKRDSCVKWNER